MLSFIRSCQSVFQSSSIIFILISNEWEFLLLTSSPAYDVVGVLGFCHSNRCVVVSHCCFNIQFLMTCSVEYLLIWFLSILISYEVRYIFKLFAHFKKLGCSFSYCWVFSILCIFSIAVFYQMFPLQLFCSGMWLSSHFLDAMLYLKCVF